MKFTCFRCNVKFEDLSCIVTAKGTVCLDCDKDFYMERYSNMKKFEYEIELQKTIEAKQRYIPDVELDCNE